MSKTDQNSIIGLFEAHSLLLRVNLRSAVTSDCPDPTVVDVANWWWTISNFWCMGRPWPGPAVLCWQPRACQSIYSSGGWRWLHLFRIRRLQTADQHTVSVSRPVLRWSSVTRTALSLCDLGSGVCSDDQWEQQDHRMGACCLVCGRGRVVVAWDSAGHNQCLWFVCLLQWHPTPLCWGEL